MAPVVAVTRPATAAVVSEEAKDHCAVDPAPPTVESEYVAAKFTTVLMGSTSPEGGPVMVTEGAAFPLERLDMKVLGGGL